MKYAQHRDTPSPNTYSYTDHKWGYDAPALGPSHRFIVKGDIVNDLLKGIGNVVNPKRVFRELTDFKPGEFVLIAVMLLAQLVSFFVSKDFPRQVELV